MTLCVILLISVGWWQFLSYWQRIEWVRWHRLCAEGEWGSESRVSPGQWGSTVPSGSLSLSPSSVPSTGTWNIKTCIKLIASVKARSISKLTFPKCDRVYSLVFCSLSHSLVSDVRVVSADHWFTANGMPGMVTTDQWQAGAQRLSGSNWCEVGRIHPPGHPPVCPVSGAPRPPEQARVSVSAAFIIQLRSPPAPDLQFAKWWTNTHVLKIKTTLKPEFLIKPTRHWTHICVPWICQICECITYKGVCLAAVYNRLHTKNSHQWWVSFETLILCGSIDTRSVSSQIYPAGAGRGDW